MKKEYIKPVTVIIKCYYETGLLAGSGGDDNDYEYPGGNGSVNPGGSGGKPQVTGAKKGFFNYGWDTDDYEEEDW